MERKKTVTINENFFAIIGPVQAWLLGLLAADGYVNDSGQIALSQSGPYGHHLITHVKSLLNHNGIIYQAPTSRQKSYCLSWRSPGLAKFLSSYHITARKSLIYEWPNALHTTLAPHFLRGYLEGDGGVGVYDSGTTRYLLIQFVGTQAFTDVAKQTIPVAAQRTELVRAANCWELRWACSKAVQVGDWLFSDDNLYRGRKFETYHNFKAQWLPRHLRYAPLKAEAKRLCAAGASVENVAQAVGVPWQTVYKWRTRHFS